MPINTRFYYSLGVCFSEKNSIFSPIHKFPSFLRGIISSCCGIFDINSPHSPTAALHLPPTAQSPDLHPCTTCPPVAPSAPLPPAAQSASLLSAAHDPLKILCRIYGGNAEKLCRKNGGNAVKGYKKIFTLLFLL